MAKDELSEETEKIVRVYTNNKGCISQIRLFVFIVHMISLMINHLAMFSSLLIS